MNRNGRGIRRYVRGSLVVCGLVAFSSCDVVPEDEAGPESAIVTDERTALELPPPARKQVRTEMRQMLSALNGVLAAIARNDIPAVADAARSGGTAIAIDADPALAERLPMEFRRLGMETHRRFDTLAEAAASGAPRDSLLQRVGALTTNCVACHETYTAVSVSPGP